MVDQARQLGSVFNYVAGVPTSGRAPAMVWIDATKSQGVTSEPLNNLCTWTLPSDPVLSEVAIYRGTYNGSTQGTFPGGSPHAVVGRASRYRDHGTTTLATRYEYWAVTFDKYGNPAPVTSANAVYLGHA